MTHEITREILYDKCVPKDQGRRSAHGIVGCMDPTNEWCKHNTEVRYPI